MKFRRAYLSEPYHFIIKEVDEDCGPGQVLVQIKGCGLCNWELNFWDGNLNYQGYPHKLGHEWGGTVVKVGEGVTKFKVGDNVTGYERGFGGFAEYRVSSENACQKLADGIDPKYATGEPLKCVMTVIRAVDPQPADVGVVLGCGPMGIWCTQILAHSAQKEIIAIDISDEKLAIAKKYGATVTINSKKEDPEAVISELTGGRMADFVIEGTGVPALLNEAQKYVMTGRGGRIALMSSHHDIAKNFDFRIAIAKNYELLFPHPNYSENEMEDFRRAVDLLNMGVIDTRGIINYEFKLDEIETAFRTLEHKPADFLKGIVVP